MGWRIMVKNEVDMDVIPRDIRPAFTATMRLQQANVGKAGGRLRPNVIAFVLPVSVNPIISSVDPDTVSCADIYEMKFEWSCSLNWLCMYTGSTGANAREED